MYRYIRNPANDRNTVDSELDLTFFMVVCNPLYDIWLWVFCYTIHVPFPRRSYGVASHLNKDGHKDNKNNGGQLWSFSRDKR